MIRQILTPLDGTRLSGSVLPFLRILMEGTGARATLISVIPPGNAQKLKSMTAYLKKAAGFLKRHGGGKVDTTVVQGSTSEELIKAARNPGVDMVAICTAAKKGFRRLAFGSVTEALMRSIVEPVFIVPPLAHNSRPTGFRKIAVPLDGSHRSGAILPAATELARALQSRLVFLRVVGSKKENVPAKVALDNLHAGFRTSQKKGVRSDLHLLHGDPAARILEFAKTNEIDLVAMATHGRSGLDRVLAGSVAEKILRSGKLPLLVVRSGTVPREHRVSARSAASRREALDFVRSAGDVGGKGPFSK